MCNLLETKYETGTNRKVELLEEFERYFDYERIGNNKFLIKDIYDVPLPGIENFFYKTIIIPVKCSKADYEYLAQCNKWSAECWNALVAQDKSFYEKNERYMTRGELQTFVKSITPLHAVGNQHVFHKYYSCRDAMFRSIQSKHKDSAKAKLPYKEKKYFTTGWDVNCSKIDYKNCKLYLSKKCISNGIYQTPVCCSFKSIPKHVVEIELIYRGKLCLAIKYKEPKTNVNIESNNVAAIDLGEIHSITSIDNNGNAIIITGRKIRSIKRLQNKERGKIQSKRSRCVDGSKQYRKYTSAIYHLNIETENKLLDCVHKISKLYLDYCIENNISRVYYGDLDSCTRGHHGEMSKYVNQKLRDWCYGQLTLQLENKLSRYGIEFVKVSEAYTSQTCPHCGHRHKPSGRNYECQCGYKQHRDLVGAMNILNFNEKDVYIERYKNFRYLRIA